VVVIDSIGTLYTAETELAGRPETALCSVITSIPIRDTDARALRRLLLQDFMSPMRNVQSIDLNIRKLDLYLIFMGS
jgi:hypothetical protein